MKTKIILFMALWIASTSAIFIWNQRFVPVAVPPESMERKLVLRETRDEAQQGTPSVSLTANAAAGTSLWLHATTNINDPLTEFQLTSNELHVATMQLWKDFPEFSPEWENATMDEKWELLFHEPKPEPGLIEYENSH